MKEALRAVGAQGFVARLALAGAADALDAGLDAPVAERGVTFSVGERQLLAFARALAGDPAMVILDEATANVDTETELRVQAGIAALLRGRTSVVIAHRLSTVREANKIAVLHKGAARARHPRRAPAERWDLREAGAAPTRQHRRALPAAAAADDAPALPRRRARRGRPLHSRGAGLAWREPQSWIRSSPSSKPRFAKQSNGDFDDLPGAGKPLELADDSAVPEDLRLAYHCLRNANFLPEEMELKKDMLRLQDLIAACGEAEESEALRRRLRDASLRFDLLVERRLGRRLPGEYRARALRRLFGGVR